MNKEDVQKQHLHYLVHACKQQIPKLRAVILYGGYGRDEGSWFQDEKNTWRPYNDYDICIVTSKKLSLKKVKSLEDNIAKEIGIKWIDIIQFSPEEMINLRPSIRNYDFKNASKVIYGDTKVLDLIPKIDASLLPMKEAQILYFTRLYTLLGSLDENGLNQDLDGEASRFFRNQMAKAILAIVDVLLLVQGAYDASYCRRVERIAELYPEKEDLIELSRWALSEKLCPKAPRMNTPDVRKMYELVHTQFLSEMYKALSLWFKKRITSPKDIEFCMKWLPISLLKRFYWIFKFRSFRMEKQISVMLAQSYIAAAWAPDRVTVNYLRRSIDLLRCVNKRFSTESTWDDIRLEATRLRMEI